LILIKYTVVFGGDSDQSLVRSSKCNRSMRIDGF